MPGIKRYFPVSHDFLDDPDVYQMRKEFGDRSVFMWMRILSWSDRNEGGLTGDPTYIASTFGRDHDPIHPTSNAKRGLRLLQWMVDHRWIERTSTGYLVCNHWNYHRTREPNKTHAGINNLPPNPPTFPNLPKRERERGKPSTLYPENFKIPDSVRVLAVKNKWRDLDQELDQFKAHHQAVGSRFVNWEAAFRKWMGNTMKFNGGKEETSREQMDRLFPDEQGTNEASTETEG